MTKFKTKPLLSLLLALVMVVTMLPMTALAAEAPEEMSTLCTDESCEHEHTENPMVAESEEAPAVTDNEESPAEETPIPSEAETAETPEAPIPADTPVVTEEIPETPEVDELPTEETPPESTVYSGYIGDSAVAWELDPASGRLFITGSGGCDTFTSPNDQPWAAVRREIREVWFNSMDTLEVENLAYWFSSCTFLETAEVPYATAIIGEGAFENCPSLYRLMLYYMDDPFTIAEGAFYSDTLVPLEVDFIPQSDVAAEILYAHDWSAENRSAYFEDVYGMMLLASGYCNSCGKTCSYSLDYEQWTSSIHCIRHWCSNCGYDQAGGVLAGNHYYNSSGYCTYCGYYNSAYDNSSVCYHTSTYKSWSGCNWTKYCSNCGAYVSSGTSHGSTYTSWSGCNWYNYCSDCGQLMDSGTSHSYTYGNWEYYNGSQHRRLYSCSSCGQGSYEYGYHATSTNYSPYSTTQHSVSSYCSTCATNISTSYTSHSFSYGSWQNYNGTQHRRLKTCSTCGYSEYEYASHSDADSNGKCDTCGYEMTRFSVTVPASLSLTVSEHGAVYAATNAAIVNNSTGAVAITGVTVSTANGWTLVPFRSNMAVTKVDSKQIGFAFNGAQSVVTGNSESLSLSDAWSIAKGASLPLSYDAVVSAMSQPVSEQVLSVVFVLNWAA